MGLLTSSKNSVPPALVDYFADQLNPITFCVHEHHFLSYELKILIIFTAFAAKRSSQVKAKKSSLVATN